MDLTKTRRRKQALFFGLLIAFSPMLIAMLGSLIGALLSCKSSQGQFAECRSLIGVDVTSVLNGMTVFHWLTIFTLPLGALAAFFFLISPAPGSGKDS